jgi:drug/metabolite transporter (DMT)-like permease
MIISSLVFAIMNGIVKYLEDFNAYELVFFRSLGTLVLTMGYLYYKKINILGNKRSLLLTRGVAGAVSLILFFLSLKYLPIGTAVVLRYLAPIFAAILAVFWLKEKINPVQWVFFLLAFVGVLIMKGVDNNLSLTGLILVGASAGFLGLVFVTIGKIGKADHPIVIINYFMAMGVLIGGVLALTAWKTPQGVEWLLLISLGVVGFIGQIFMTRAFQMASTNQIAPIKYLEVVFTVLIGATWFMEVYTLWSLLGIVLVLTGLFLNIIFKSKPLKGTS